MPEMTKTQSSHVWEVGYDPDKAELHVRYIPSVKEPAGRLVVYREVDGETAKQVLTAPSIGQALHQFVRGRFTHQ